MSNTFILNVPFASGDRIDFRGSLHGSAGGYSEIGTSSGSGSLSIQLFATDGSPFYRGNRDLVVASDSGTPVPLADAPEPSTAVLVLFGCGLAWIRKRLNDTRQ